MLYPAELGAHKIGAVFIEGACLRVKRCGGVQVSLTREGAPGKSAFRIFVGSLAQLVEQRTLNPLAKGSSPL